jgi:hypothetical protein
MIPFPFFRYHLSAHTCIPDKELITQSFLQATRGEGAIEARTQNSTQNQAWHDFCGLNVRPDALVESQDFFTPLGR